MLTEQCVACGADVPLSGAVHMLVNPKGEAEVVDGYLCRGCYEEHVEPILPGDAAAEGDESEAAEEGEAAKEGEAAEEGEGQPIEKSEAAEADEGRPTAEGADGPAPGSDAAGDDERPTGDG